jgi:hypothetical protein
MGIVVLCIYGSAFHSHILTPHRSDSLLTLESLIVQVQLNAIALLKPLWQRATPGGGSAQTSSATVTSSSARIPMLYRLLADCKAYSSSIIALADQDFDNLHFPFYGRLCLVVVAHANAAWALLESLVDDADQPAEEQQQQMPQPHVQSRAAAITAVLAEADYVSVVQALLRKFEHFQRHMSPKEREQDACTVFVGKLRIFSLYFPQRVASIVGRADQNLPPEPEPRASSVLSPRYAGRVGAAVTTAAAVMNQGTQPVDGDAALGVGASTMASDELPTLGPMQDWTTLLDSFGGSAVASLDMPDWDATLDLMNWDRWS